VTAAHAVPPPRQVLHALVVTAATAWLAATRTAAADGPRVHVVPPGPDAQQRLQERFVDAAPGDVIQLEEGIYRLTHQLDLVADSITIRGRGAERTILSFQGQSAGAHGIEATGDNLLLEHFAVEDTAGDAVKILGSRNVVLRGVRAEWTGAPTADNGAYGLYPVQCENVLMEECTARGASDAGLYVGQCKHVVVRRCLAERNVAGIEIENTLAADVHDNLAHDNAGGILVFDLPGLPLANGGGVRVFRNRSTANNHPNFADRGSMVASVPPGTGVMILATDRVDVFDNDIVGNDSTAVLVLSYLALGKKYDDPRYDPIPEAIAIRGNRIAGCGGRPQGELATLLMPLLGRRFPDILWDGVMPPGTATARLRIADNTVAPDGAADNTSAAHTNTTDAPPAAGTAPARDAVTFANFRVAEINPLALLTGAVKPNTEVAALAADIVPLPEVRLAPFDAPSRELPAAVRFYRGLPSSLAALDLFSGPPARQTPAAGVVPYALATELFSDHSRKRRFIRLPEGAAIAYRDAGVLEFPVGTLIAKTFSFPNASAEGGERHVETRIEMRTPEGWFGASYLWNDAQDDAVLCLGGRQVDVVEHAAGGSGGVLTYEIPGANQCLSCHAQVRDGGRPSYEPLGPTAANMHRPADDAAGDQLARLAAAGRLTGLPDGGATAALPAAFDPQAGSVADRARGWLDVNCAHCHNPAGSARTTGLDLRRTQTDPARAGVWKSPVAAGRGAGGRAYDIVPGKPDDSILVHRLETVEPAVMMPSLGRKTVHAEAVALVRAWIEHLPAER